MYLYRKLRWPVFGVVITGGLALLLLSDMARYVTWWFGGDEPVFVVEKRPWSQSSVWRAAFVLHLAGAASCLLAGFPLFFQATLRRPRIHRFLGYVYLNSVLWLAAPAGLLIAPVSKGGAPAAAGFLLTGVVWWVATWLGYRRIVQGDVASHIRWMVRSYSIALSAIWFRVLHVALNGAGMDPLDNYVASIWGSLLVSLILSEWCIGSVGQRHIKTFSFPSMPVSERVSP
jgi:Predicted membrane protein (DUF2306)